MVQGNLRIDKRHIDFRFGENGELTRICRGKLHKGKYIPLANFRVIKSGRRAGHSHSYCRECEALCKGTERLVPVGKYLRFLKFVEDRIGKAEAGRRLGLSYHTVWRIRSGQTTHLRRSTARRITLLYIEVRENNIKRHPLSIRHGASARGRKERIGA